MDDLPALPPGTGVMLCGHGSRNQLAVGEFADLTDDLRARLPGVPVEYGYLEFADPVIHHGLDKLRAQGLTRILAVPGMLFAAGHAKNDIPSVLNTYAAAHPGHRDHLWPRARRRPEDCCAPPATASRKGFAPRRDRFARTETLLLVVGRGASDPDANANVAKVMRMLWEGMGFGWGEVAYSGVTFPLVDAGARARGKARLPPHRRLPVFPLHRRAGEAHLRRRRGGAGAVSRSSRSSTRPISATIRWSSTPSSTACAKCWSART